MRARARWKGQRAYLRLSSPLLSLLRGYLDYIFPSPLHAHTHTRELQGDAAFMRMDSDRQVVRRSCLQHLRAQEQAAPLIACLAFFHARAELVLNRLRFPFTFSCDLLLFMRMILCYPTHFV